MYTLLYLSSSFVVEKGDFLKIVKIPYPKNRFLVTLRSFFSTQRIGKISKNPFVRGGCQEHYVKFSAFYLQKGAGG